MTSPRSTTATSAWFAAHHKTPPRSLADLTEPAYRNLFVTEGATTSSPGLAFLLTTIARYGSGWQQYWRQLMANGTKVDAGWGAFLPKWRPK